MKRVPPETIAQILADLSAGQSLQSISRRTGVAVSTVHRYRDAFGLPYRLRPTRTTSTQWKTAIALVDGGMSQVQAAKIAGVSQGHLSRHLARRAA
jgi:transposase-like protein